MIEVLMLTPIVEQWNSVIAPILFSLRDSITSVATQRRAAIIAFQDMQARRCEDITQENERLATRHVDAEKPAFPTRLPPILKFCEHHQTGWNVRKCHACHAKQHDNLPGNIRKGEVLQVPP